MRPEPTHVEHRQGHAPEPVEGQPFQMDPNRISSRPDSPVPPQPASGLPAQRLALPVGSELPRESVLAQVYQPAFGQPEPREHDPQTHCVNCQRTGTTLPGGRRDPGHPILLSPISLASAVTHVVRGFGRQAALAFLRLSPQLSGLMFQQIERLSEGRSHE